MADVFMTGIGPLQAKQTGAGRWSVLTEDGDALVGVVRHEGGVYNAENAVGKVKPFDSLGDAVRAFGAFGS